MKVTISDMYNAHSVYSVIYLMKEFISTNRSSVNIITRIRMAAYKRRINNTIKAIKSCHQLPDWLILDFMTLICNNPDVFPEDAFEYRDLSTQDYLVIKIRDNKYKDYDLGEDLKDIDFKINYNRSTHEIVVNTRVNGVFYNHVFKLLGSYPGIYPDNNLNRAIFKQVRNIMWICTDLYMKGDYDGIYRLFKTKPYSTTDNETTY